MFNAPAAPEPMATANKEIREVDNETLVGEITRPTIQVNKTKDITLGFIKLKNDFRSNTKPDFMFLGFVNIKLKLFYFR